MTVKQFGDLPEGAEFFRSGYRWKKTGQSQADREGVMGHFFPAQDEVESSEERVVTHVLIIRHGSECIAAVPFTDFESEVRAERLLVDMRKEHYQLQSQHYRSWDEYCATNPWWVTKVPLL